MKGRQAMNGDFQRALEESLRRVESGESIDDAIMDFPQYADRLREHMALAVALPHQPEVSGQARGRQAMLTALASGNEAQGGLSTMGNAVSNAFKIFGGVALAGIAAISIAYFSGNLDVQVGGGEAEASDPTACLDQVLGNLADPQDGVFSVDDLIAARAAYETQNTDPRYDRDSDGDVDLDDLMVYIQELKTCIGASLPPLP